MPRRAVLHISQITLLLLLAIVTLGADNASARLDRDSHKMMCVCGCNQMLGECNHVSCPSSGPMRVQLVASIAKGESDDAIFHDFQQQYGPVVLAEPMFTPFNHLAWIMPPAVLFLGIGVTMLVARKWKVQAAPVAPDHHEPGDTAIRQRIRHETEL